ncbi:isoprenyl transferase [candidate division KSB1 bacterium]|nr:isoprenyl transferase [candidate division KSB1 bacterium]
MNKEIVKVKDIELQQLKGEILKHGKIPRHVAIIMDGNGRWARRRGLPRVAGHRAGINSVREVVAACGELGIEVLTLYTFSKENWQRPEEEVTALMRLLLMTIKKEVYELNKNNVRLSIIGELDDLPTVTRKSLLDSIEILKKNTGLILNLALSYSSRREIISAVSSICQDIQNQNLRSEQIDEQLFSKYLYTANFPDPDLLIRTSGELRISNFLLWQIAYAELYISDILWPDFGKYEFFKAVQAYQLRDRRFGKVSNQPIMVN